MKEIHRAFRKLLSSSYLLLIVFLFQCDDSDDGKETGVCTKDLRIVKVLPNRNPIGAPILIVGKSFSSSTKVTFNEIESEITIVNDSTITTSAPFELEEILGLLELSVIDGNCSFTTGFTLTPTFEDVERPSPPTIFFPDPSKKVIINVPDTIAKKKFYYWNNIWGNRQTLVFSETNQYDDQLFTGTEYAEAANSLWGRIDPEKRSIEIKTYYDQNIPYTPESPGDHLVGGFYKMTLLTRSGMVSDTFLFLQSTVTGRQYIFKSNK